MLESVDNQAAESQTTDSLTVGVAKVLDAEIDRARDAFALFTAEVQLSKQSIKSIVVATVIASFAVLIGWSLLVVALSLMLQMAGLSVVTAIFSLALLHGIVAYLCIGFAQRARFSVGISKTMQHLKGVE